jgi:hypothetical protein
MDIHPTRLIQAHSHFSVERLLGSTLSSGTGEITFHEALRHSADTATTLPSSSTSSLTGNPTSKSAASFQFSRLWRGVQAVAVGCIPAHAMYFSAYEIVKAMATDTETGRVSTIGNSLAGAAATIAHDIIMSPLDTIKQRMQCKSKNQPNEFFYIFLFSR